MVNIDENHIDLIISILPNLKSLIDKTLIWYPKVESPNMKGTIINRKLFTRYSSLSRRIEHGGCWERHAPPDSGIPCRGGSRFFAFRGGAKDYVLYKGTHIMSARPEVPDDPKGPGSMQGTLAPWNLSGFFKCSLVQSELYFLSILIQNGITNI